MIEARNPRAEAAAMVPPGVTGLVLEPSLPVNHDPDWFADDPTAPAGATTVTPIPGEGRTWTDLAAVDPTVADYAREHWLGNLADLEPIPDAHTETRRALHQLAFFALAPKRFSATGKLGLRYTHRGFGTPFFGDDEQVRVEAGTLVRQRAGSIDAIVPKTVGEAAAFLGLDYQTDWFTGFHDPLAPIDPEERISIDPAAADAIGAWFGFSTHALERARRTPDARDVTRVQLWPEHFDPAFEMGDQDEGRRASYGASPGDDSHPAPYLYVAAWGELDRADPFWNAPAFNGALLSYDDLLSAPDQMEAAVQFFASAHERLTT